MDSLFQYIGKWIIFVLDRKPYNNEQRRYMSDQTKPEDLILSPIKNTLKEDELMRSNNLQKEIYTVDSSLL